MDHAECGYRGVGLEQTQVIGTSGCWKFVGENCIEPLGKVQASVAISGAFETQAVCHTSGFLVSGPISVTLGHIHFHSIAKDSITVNLELICLAITHLSLQPFSSIIVVATHQQSLLSYSFLVCCCLHEDDPVLQSPSLEVIDLSKYNLEYSRYHISPKLSHHYIVPLSLILSVHVPRSYLNIIPEYRKC